ncbi:MAG: CGNR zinc finger domain-containing protein [Gaiellaceae bacterium]
MSPRYDVPKAAPEPLRQVQLFVNSIDVHNDVEWLPEWLESRRLGHKRKRATELREALRLLVLANNGKELDESAVELVNRAAERVAVQVDAAGTARIVTDGDALDDMLVIVFSAMFDGTWSRLKACRTCQWCFYDYSPNRSATWCSMQLCGNRTKTRRYRGRDRRRAS